MLELEVLDNKNVSKRIKKSFDSFASAKMVKRRINQSFFFQKNVQFSIELSDSRHTSIYFHIEQICIVVSIRAWSCLL